MSKSNQQDPAPKKQSIFQTILVIFLVLAVGIIFGIGQSSITGAMAKKSIQQVYKNVTNVDIQRFVRVQTIVSLLQYGMEPHNVDDQMWDGFYRRQFNQMARNPANVLVLAGLAAEQGMMPAGEELEEIVKQFLSQELPGQSYKNMNEGIRAVIQADVKGRSLQPIEIKGFLAQVHARENYINRHAPNIAINSAAAESFALMEREKIRVEEATISTATLIEKYKPDVEKDKEALDNAYQELKDERFVIPRRCHLTCITVHVGDVKQAVVVSDEDIAAYYEANKETDPSLKKEVVPDKPEEVKEGEPPPAPEYVVKTLQESKAYIRDKLSADKAQLVTEELLNRFTVQIGEKGLLDQDRVAEGKREELLKLAAELRISAEDERLSEPVGLTVRSDMGADDPGNSETYVLEDKEGKHFARMQLPAPGLFADDVDHDDIFQKTQAFDNADLYVIQIVDNFTPSDYQPFETVRSELVLYVSAQRAYPDLVNEARSIATALSEQRDGTLVQWFEQKAHKSWAAQITTESYEPLKSVNLASSDEDEALGLEARPLIAYCMPGKQFFVAEAANDGDMKRVTISRIIDYSNESPNSDPEVEPPPLAEAGHETMKQVAMQLTRQLDLSDQIQEALEEE